MEGFSFKSRAVAFALAAGAIAFILALIAGAKLDGDGEGLSLALIVALICGTLCWASAQRAIAGAAEAVDAVAARLSAAATGDLTSPAPPAIARALPQVAHQLDEMFSRMRATLDSVNALALRDSVTRLPNRRHFRREADRIIEDFDPQARATLLFIDLDHFKMVNDTLGHAIGDHLLEMVADRLRRIAINARATTGPAEPGPLVARLSGDEFTLFVPHIAHSTAALEVAHGLSTALSDPFECNGHQIKVGASIGVALYPEHGRRLAGLMRSADVAMYHAKAQGGDQVQLFTGVLASRQEDRARQEQELRAAIDRDQFALAFQPQVHLRTGAIVAAEALLRWRHPDGTRLPASFIATAEDCGLIVGIGDWVVDAVAATLGRWHDTGFGQRLTLNTSERELRNPDFFTNLHAALERHGAPAHLLEIEIGETMAMTCPPAILDAIAALRRDGVAVAVDDFGRGFSNLARLKDMPLDRVKLDRSLIRDLASSEQARAIVHSLITLIHGLGYQVVAEGIETAEQADVLRVLGCDAGQGFGIARPMTEEAYRDWRDQPLEFSAAAMRAELNRARAG